MGLKGYRLWVMGQLDSNVQSPTELAVADAYSWPTRTRAASYDFDEKMSTDAVT
jgi:hypothetical protein